MKSASPNTRNDNLPGMRRNVKCAGFTLIEAMVVIFIATFLMAMTTLGIQNVVKRHVPEELISELHLARMMAIRQHQTITVGFNPDSPQAAMAWTVNGVPSQRMLNLGTQGEGYVFDSTPPGTPAPPAPDNAFIFSPMGFISTNPGGNVAGNIYLTNLRNTRSYRIQTTIAGGIDLARYDAQTDAWISAY